MPLRSATLLIAMLACASASAQTPNPIVAALSKSLTLHASFDHGFIREVPEPMCFLPPNVRTEPGSLLVRVDAPSGEVTAQRIRHRSASAPPEWSALRVQALRSLVEPQIRPLLDALRLLSAFSIVALGLSAFTLAQAVSADAQRRKYEIAVRHAVGASPRHMLGLVAGRLTIVCLGAMVCGVAAAE